MDDDNIFQDFVIFFKKWRIYEFVKKTPVFTNNFSAFLEVTDQDIYYFVKEIYSSDSSRPHNGEILIP